MAIKKTAGLAFQTSGKGQALPGPGVVLECTDRGTLVKIRRDDLGLLPGVAAGVSFHHLIKRDNLDKAFAFLAELRKRKSAFGWELKVSLADQVTTLFVGGVMENRGLTIYGTQTRSGLLRFSRYFMDNLLMRAVDQAIRENIGMAPKPDERHSTLDEQLRLANSKLANLRQALARKDAKLKRVTAELQVIKAENHHKGSLLPICSCCKRIRNGQGDWTQVENYFKSRFQVQFTHSICPECVTNVYPTLYLKERD
ncbi:MAG: hypothetical protein P8168_02185 [Deltaproteobacteria bacterium]